MIDFNIINNDTHKTSNNNIKTNEKGALKNEDFLKLFLAEIKFQDPLKPMDAEKMLSTTLQMSTIESNTKQTETLENIKNSLKQPEQVNYINMIDKNIIIDNETIKITSGHGQYMAEIPNNFSGRIILKDENGKIIKEKEISGNKGVNYFNIDNLTKDGLYNVSFQLFNDEDIPIKFNQNKFRVIGVKNENGNINFRVSDDKLISKDKVKEYTI